MFPQILKEDWRIHKKAQIEQFGIISLRCDYYIFEKDC